MKPAPLFQSLSQLNPGNPCRQANTFSVSFRSSTANIVGETLEDKSQALEGREEGRLLISDTAQSLSVDSTSQWEQASRPKHILAVIFHVAPASPPNGSTRLKDVTNPGGRGASDDIADSGL